MKDTPRLDILKFFEPDTWKWNVWVFGGFDEALTNDVIHLYVAAFPNMAMSFLFQSFPIVTEKSPAHSFGHLQLYGGLRTVTDAALVKVCSEVRLRTKVGNEWKVIRGRRAVSVEDVFDKTDAAWSILQ